MITQQDQDTPTAAVQEPPLIENRPLQVGSFVVLHSLQREDMNSLMGEVVGYNPDIDPPRYQIRLDTGNKVQIKKMNLRRIPLASMEDREIAFNIAQEEAKVFYECLRNGRPYDTSPLEEALEQDRCNPLVYRNYGQHAVHQLHDERLAIKYFCRALAQDYAAEPFISIKRIHAIRSELATCYGVVGMLDEEAEQLELAFQENPNNLHAMFTMAANLMQRDIFDRAIELYEQVYRLTQDLPEVNRFLSQEALLKERARPTLIQCLLQAAQSALENKKSETYRVTIDYTRRVEELNPDIDQKTRAITLRAALFAYISLEEESERHWATFLEVIRQAHALDGLPPVTQGFISFSEALVYERKGDILRTSQPEVAREAYKTALRLAEESNNIHPTAVTTELLLRIEVKSQPGARVEIVFESTRS